MFESIKALYGWLKRAIFGAESTDKVADGPETTAEPTTVQETTTTETTITEKWTVTPFHDPVFEKIGRVYLDNGDLMIRSDRDSRGFVLLEGDLDQALTGGTGTVRLLDLTGTVGTARLSTSGLAMNIVIANQLHTVPMRSLTLVLSGKNKRGPLFIPAEVMAPDPVG